MQISAKGEYAIRAVLDLALQRERGLTPIQGIATRQGIPQRYLEQVLLALKRAGLLASKRGSTGGHHLPRAPGGIPGGGGVRAGAGGGAPGSRRRPPRGGRPGASPRARARGESGGGGGPRGGGGSSAPFSAQRRGGRNGAG